MGNNKSDNQSQITTTDSNEKNLDVPKDKKRFIEQKSVSLSMQGFMPMQNPMIEKLTPEHITAILNNSDKESERYFKQNQFNRAATFIFAIIMLIILAVVMCVFKENINDIHDILITIVSVIAGAIGGYGYGYKKGSEQ